MEKRVKIIPGVISTKRNPESVRLEAADSGFMNPLYKPESSPGPLEMPGLGVTPTKVKPNKTKGK